MQKKKQANSKITQEEVQARLQKIQALKDIDKVKKQMQAGQTSGAAPVSGSSASMPLENLLGIGQDEDAVYLEVDKLLHDLLTKIAEFAFSADAKTRLFPKNKIAHLVNVMRKAHLEMESRFVMDIFKDRVKQLHDGKLPKIKERQGMFGQVVRPMRVDEIAAKFTIEDDLPAGTETPTSTVGTKNGLLRYLQNTLLANDDIYDPLKASPRRVIALFLDAADIVSLKSCEGNQKYFNAALLTPESIQPKSRTDKDKLVKLRAVFKRANEWLDEKLKSVSKDAKAAEGDGKTKAASKPQAAAKSA
ncbi:MAG: hypothetical protein GC154_05835 [bacterium]|nr:hypothetical protein [bacterium]